MFPTLPDKLDITEEEHTRTNELFRSLIREACKSKPLPETLYHYTTPIGFNGIVGSGVLRATHVAYTNDGVEALHAAEVLRARILERQLKTTGPDEQGLLDGIDQGLRNTTPFNTLPHAISCFCESGDQLSQWRGYGLGEGGIAIGFNSQKMVASQSRWNGLLVPVLYTDTEQQTLTRNLLDSLVAEYKATLVSRPIADRATHLTDFLTVIAAKATLPSAMIKHHGFAEEKEWRLIHPILSMFELGFQPKSTHLSPTVELAIGAKRDGKPDLLPITDIWFGPGRYQEHALHSCKAFLERHEYAGVRLHKSRTPFRSII